MKLPNSDSPLIEEGKIVGYLLNPTHRYGMSKARFFSQFGFCVEDWEVFSRALREHVRTHDVARVKQTGFGPRFEVDGELAAPDGRRPYVRTVWQLDEGEVRPRLITAHPLKESDDD